MEQLIKVFADLPHGSYKIAQYELNLPEIVSGNEAIRWVTGKVKLPEYVTSSWSENSTPLSLSFRTEVWTRSSLAGRSFWLKQPEVRPDLGTEMSLPD